MPTRRVVGVAIDSTTHSTVVACDDGTVWMWAPVPAETEAEQREQEVARMRHEVLPHTWIQFHTPIPGTESDRAYQEARV